MTQRPIEFRARLLVEVPGFYKNVGDWIESGSDSNGLRAFWHMVDAGKLDFDTVCQFTGFYDKNDQQIWEGDICVKDSVVKELQKYKDRTYEEAVKLSPKQIVEWKKAKFNILPDPDGSYLIVIGNIYQNPELLHV